MYLDLNEALTLSSLISMDLLTGAIGDNYRVYAKIKQIININDLLSYPKNRIIFIELSLEENIVLLKYVSERIIALDRVGARDEIHNELKSIEQKLMETLF